MQQHFAGFYRVNYDAHNWELLIKHLEDVDRFRQIEVINRAQLIDDALNLARGNRLPYKTALSVTRYLKHEDEFLPWKAALTALGYIDTMLVKTGHYDKFKVGAYFYLFLNIQIYLFGQRSCPREAVSRGQSSCNFYSGGLG